MSSETPVAHSIVEAYLCLLVRLCPVCRHGAREVDPPESADEVGRIRIRATCTNCGAANVGEFVAPGSVSPVDPISSSMPINPTPARSSLIDVGQWLTLSGLMLSAAEQTPDAQEGRWCKVRAAQCLDEALKFFAEGNEVPPKGAFFAEASQRAFRDHPQKFTRGRIIDLKAELPTLESFSHSSRAPRATHGKRTWWKFWQTRNGTDS